MSRLRRAAGIALLGLMLTAGCTGGSAPDAGRAPEAPGSTAHERRPASPSGSASSIIEPEPTPPPQGACYRLDFASLPEPTSSEEPVDCSEPHTAQTIHVGELDTVVDGHAVSVDSDHVREQLSEVCPRRLARFLGGTAEERRLSRFEAIWFSPTFDQADAGAEWFRCDVVALAGDEELFRLGPSRRLRGVLKHDGALATYGLCGTAAPGTPGFSRVICGRRHAWRAISTIPLAAGRDYPGEGEVRAAGDSVCRDQARGLAEDPLRFRYGWEWPTREQWEHGQHYGYCWIPD